MKKGKQILNYFGWTAVAILIAFCYLRLLIGPLPNEDTFGDFWFPAFIFFVYGMLYVGSVLGGTIALFFILTDIFYLKKKLNTNPKKRSVRFGVLLGIAMVICIIHYLLEKVIDII